jgi:hypothetical protein
MFAQASPTLFRHRFCNRFRVSKLASDRWPFEDRRMLAFIERFCLDERGCLLASEWAIMASILTLGTVLGLLAIHQKG